MAHPFCPLTPLSPRLRRAGGSAFTSGPGGQVTVSGGTATQPVEAGYMANAWIRMKHPDYDELRGMLDVIGRTVKVRAR